jgi:O-succinylbenzoate synthase
MNPFILATGDIMLTGLTSSLGAIIILTLASLNQDLQDLVPDIDELQTMVINNFRPWAFSSLELVVSILEDIRKKRRLLVQI